MSRPRILVAPLDWGLGHATRCVPIINKLLELTAQVIIAGEGEGFSLLKKEFSELEFVDLPSYPVSYTKANTLKWHFATQFIKMMRFIQIEHHLLNEIIKNHSIDAVISDNRYGLYNSNLPCVIITHQLSPQLGLLSFPLKNLLKRLIGNFSQCWVPDIGDEKNIAGKLSYSTHLNIPVSYLGVLSRFHAEEVKAEFEVLAILSGPEPSRSIFETKVRAQLDLIPGNHAIVRGSNENAEIKSISNGVQTFNLVSQRELSNLISASKYLVSRSGYSSIMDYVALKRNALIVPTPGQPEQEYLARYHKEKGQFVVQYENQLNLKDGIEELSKKTRTINFDLPKLLEKVLTDFYDSL